MGFVFKSRHNGFNYVHDVFFNERKAGFILESSGTSKWDGDLYIRCTNFRIFRYRGIRPEEIGQEKTLDQAKALILKLHREKNGG